MQVRSARWLLHRDVEDCASISSSHILLTAPLAPDDPPTVMSAQRAMTR